MLRLKKIIKIKRSDTPILCRVDRANLNLEGNLEVKKPKTVKLQKTDKSFLAISNLAQDLFSLGSTTTFHKDWCTRSS